uniref:Uncharacterized protein n=1 Tax=Acrobeloides nanus TaxID=290746 RepID=A0A914EP20_9BILA
MKNRAVFITGCDSGFGRLLALKCAKSDIPTFAGCLTVDGQRNLEKESSCLKSKIKTVLLDITKDESVEAAFDFVKKNLEADQKLWALVNNAGTLTSYGPDEWVSIDQYRRALEVNTFGMIRCVHVTFC